MKPIKKILQKLQNVKETNNTKWKWQAICPAHNDTKPSLSICEDEKGNIGLKCFAGCTTEEICKAIGLKKNDLYVKKYFPLICAYNYWDEDYKTLYQACRREDKSFSFRRPRPDVKNPNLNDPDNWVWNLDCVELIPYRLPQLLEWDAVFIVEGEKDVENLIDLQLPATCNPGGAGKWRAEYNEYFRDKSVCIVPDNDEVGHRHANSVASSLYNIADEVLILELPNLKRKGDVSNWIEEGGTKEELIELKVFNSIEESESQNITCTEMWNADFLVRNYGDKIRFNHSSGEWHVWDGTRWKRDSIKKVKEFVKKNARNILELALKTNGDDFDLKKKAAEVDWALKSEMRHNIDNTLNLAESIHHIAVEETDFDQNPYLLNCQNGTYNFETGKLQPHNPSDNLSKMINVEYIEGAECPYWLESLKVIFNGNAIIIRFIRQLIGMSLTGIVHKELMVFCHGAGENGKSRFFNCMEMLLGDYFQKITSELLMKKERSGQPRAYEMAKLPGKRFVLGSEIGKEQEFSVEFTKELTGGDRLNARNPYCKPFDFSPSHKLFLYGNREPKVKDASWGFWRRMQKIPFTVAIPERFKKDTPEVIELYKKELPGILQWAIAGYWDFKDNGLKVPKSVSRETKEYRDASDVIKQFLKEKCDDTDVNAKISVGELYTHYKSWCGEGGEKELTKIMFNREVEEHRFEKTKGTGGKHIWQGLRTNVRRKILKKVPKKLL